MSTRASAWTSGQSCCGSWTFFLCTPFGDFMGLQVSRCATRPGSSCGHFGGPGGLLGLPSSGWYYSRLSSTSFSRLWFLLFFLGSFGYWCHLRTRTWCMPVPPCGGCTRGWCGRNRCWRWFWFSDGSSWRSFFLLFEIACRLLSLDLGKRPALAYGGF